MSQTRAPVSGGVLDLLSAQAHQLSESSRACRQISVRAHFGNNEASIGHSEVSEDNRWAFVLEGETYTIGPFGVDQGIRPCDIYIRGAIGDSFSWGGFHS
jgi:hypothetical protein